MRFALYVLLTSMVFIRPAEIHPALMGLPIYEGVILACLAASYPLVAAQVRPRTLLERPINACAVGMLAAIVLSHAANIEPERALDHGVEFAKILINFFLLVSVVDTPKRLEKLLTWIGVFAFTITALAVLHYHHIVTIPAIQLLETDVEGSGRAEGMVRRLGSTGLFMDPNDMCLMLVMAMIISLYQILELRRLYWIAPLLLFGHALTLTHSRGGFIGMLVAVGAFLLARFGRRALPLGALVVPVIFVLFAGRQTDLRLSNATGVTRIELWAEGMRIFLRYPLFGIGSLRFEEYFGHVAHNSFIHCYTELGLFGGTLFLSAFYLALWTLVRLGGAGVPPMSPTLARMRPYILAVGAGYAGGLLSLSYPYIIPTYTVLGLSSVYIRLAEAEFGVPVVRVNGPLLRRLAFLSLAFIVTAQVGVRLLVRIGGH